MGLCGALSPNEKDEGKWWAKCELLQCFDLVDTVKGAYQAACSMESGFGAESQRQHPTDIDILANTADPYSRPPSTLGKIR